MPFLAKQGHSFELLCDKKAGYSQAMKAIYRQLAMHLKIPDIVEGRAPLEQIWSLPDAPIATVREFFLDHYPINGFEGHLRILPADDVITENHRMVPGGFVNPLGFLVFGNALDGDAVCADGLSGAVLILPHDGINSERVSFGWNRETMRIDKAPLSRESLYRVATHRFESIRAFFEDWVGLMGR